MIKKIISGGQTGADQAALDAAIKWNLPYGGWVPKGRKTEAGRLSKKYHMQEMPDISYPRRTEQNVIDSDGTLIISHGRLTGSSGYTRKMAEKHGRPWLHIDLFDLHAFRAAHKIYDWISGAKIKTLNVAGPRASRDPHVYHATRKILEIVFYMQSIKSILSKPYKAAHLMPHTVDEAVDILIAAMSLRDRVKVANMLEADLVELNITLGSYIRNRFGLWSGNRALLRSCKSMLKQHAVHKDEASALIILELWRRLKESHMLKVIK